MHILVIEDNPDLAANICDYLEAKGHSTDAAGDGVTGLHLAVTHDYDVIVLDVILPGLDGFTLCRRLGHAPHGLPRRPPWHRAGRLPCPLRPRRTGLPVLRPGTGPRSGDRPPSPGGTGIGPLGRAGPGPQVPFTGRGLLARRGWLPIAPAPSRA